MKRSIAPEKIKQITYLRERGNSLLEIKNATGVAYGTVFKYMQHVEILPKYQETWKRKRGGSKNRALKDWAKAQEISKKLVLPIDSKDRLFILAALYWGEGNKKELSLINSDPSLVKVFLICLKEIGVVDEDIKITLRMYEDMDASVVKNFWSETLSIPLDKISNINVLLGKKQGKLKYGMCRVRVRKGAPYFKLIMSMIDLIKSELNAAVVQWIEQDTPNV